jgi:hypothetical protein
MRRLVAAVIAGVLIGSACSTTPNPASAPPIDAAAPTATPGGSTLTEPTPGASAGSVIPTADGLTPLPADIVGAVAAIVDAPSADARVAATRAALSLAGITISGDAAATPAGPAGIVLAPEDVEQIAAEAADRRSYRATLSDFATVFGGMALLPPNDGLAAGLPENWLDVPPAESSGTVRIDAKELPGRVAAAVTAWVTSSIANHADADADLVSLTNAPLLLAELARRRADRIDLARPFSARDLRMGWLEITILEAGMRAMLSAAMSSGVVAATPGRDLLGAPGRGAPDVRGGHPVDETACDLFKQMLDSRVPLASEAIAGQYGHQLKEFVKSFAESLLGKDSTIAQNVGRAFKVLSVLAHIQALAMFYSDARVKVEMEPAFYHQPDGGVKTVSAVVRAGIDDAVWEAARQARQLSPFATAARSCARFLGLPVWQDQVDLGNAMAGWKVQWRLTKGGGRVQIPARDQFTSGRLERSLTPESDHQAVDAIDYEVLPEKRENHPGDELTEQVEFCAEVFAKEPPGGGSIVGAGFAGVSLAGGGYAGLLAAVAKLITGWVATLQGIKACGQATVSYHKPLPGEWKGKITVNTYRHEDVSSTITEVLGPPWGTTVTTGRSEVTVDATSQYLFAGKDKDVGASQIPMPATAFTHGAASFESSSQTRNAWTHSGCNYDKVETSSTGGGWSDEGSASVSITLSNDGTYWISVSGHSPPDVILEGLRTTQASVKTPRCEDNISGDFKDFQFVAPNQGLLGGQRLEGHLDPLNPGNRLNGSMEFTFGDGWSTTVTWDIVHEGPIILPAHSVGG